MKIFLGKRYFPPKIDHSNQDKWGTTYQSKFHADFKSAHRFFIWLRISRDISIFPTHVKKMTFL
jgi:hypothetical protein